MDINVKSELAGGLFINHGIGIVIGSKVRTNGILKIYQGVTLGGNFGKKVIVYGKEISMPFIENNVSIFPGAKVLGPVIIGENSQVGANSVITRNIPPNSIVIGANKIFKKLEC